MKLTELHSQWAIDQDFDLSQPDRILRDIPKLHQKWWRIYTDERERYIALKAEYDELRLAKMEWYIGRMDDDERQRRGWPPQPLRLVKADVEIYLGADGDLSPRAARLQTQEVKMKFIEDVIKHINQRGYSVHTYVDWLKFSQGAM